MYFCLIRLGHIVATVERWLAGQWKGILLVIYVGLKNNANSRCWRVDAVGG